MIEFVKEANAPTGLNYSSELAKLIINRNIPIIRDIFEKIYKGIAPAQVHSQFVGLCQQKDTKKSIKIRIDEFERVTRDFVAIFDNSKPNNS